jgi:signal transduction histidine kinase
MERRRYVVDTLVAACAFAFSVAVARHGTSDPDAHDADVLAYVLLAVYSGSVAIRGRFPVWSVAVGLASGFAYAAASYPPALTPVVLLSVYTAATHLSWTASRRLLVIAVIVSALGATLGPGPTDVSAPVLVAATWLLGHYVRTRRLYTDELERKNRELEQAQHDLARHAVMEERLRIARELHDVVAHTMSVVAVHAGSGRMVAADHPAEAEHALETIEITTRSALQEMRRLLGVLRTGEDEQPGALGPAPGLRDLDGLVAHVVASGIAVEVRVEGRRPDVPPGVDLSAHRVVQEALTNVVKHAGAARATVAVRYTDTEIVVDVVDDGRPADGDRARPGGPGHGLIGMRERVAMHGGQLDVGPRPPGGYRVTARFPIEGAS